MAVAEKPTENRALTREETAERILPLLTNEPQSEAALARQLGVRIRQSGVVANAFKDGLGILESRHEAKRVGKVPGFPRGGWLRYDASLDGEVLPPLEVEFPYEWEVLPVDDMFIDEDYQRPLTNLVRKIVREFDPVLFQTLAVNRRKRPNRRGKHYAVVDGQTRWTAATRRSIQRVPCIVFDGLTPQQEAEIFVKIQKERRGHTSVGRFKAQIAARDEESLAILEMAHATGWEIGNGEGELRAVSTLEQCFRQDELELERTLVTLRAIWPNRVPDDTLIKGFHYLFRNYPIGERVRQEIEDEVLVRKVQLAGIGELERSMSAFRQTEGKRKSNARLMALAIQKVYKSRKG